MAVRTKPVGVKPISPEAPVRPEPPPLPVRVRHRSLIAVTLRAAALRLCGKQISVADSVLATALEDLAKRLDHPAYCLQGAMPETIEDLFREALRIGVSTGVEWWTGVESNAPYADIMDAPALVARVQADVLPELMTRYYMLKE